MFLVLQPRFMWLRKLPLQIPPLSNLSTVSLSLIEAACLLLIIINDNCLFCFSAQTGEERILLTTKLRCKKLLADFYACATHEVIIDLFHDVYAF